MLQFCMIFLCVFIILVPCLLLSSNTGYQIFKHGFQISKHVRACRHVILRLLMLITDDDDDDDRPNSVQTVSTGEGRVIS